MTLYICDYQIPRSEDMDCLIVEADDIASAERKAIERLKTLHIPKRYLINVSEVL